MTEHAIDRGRSRGDATSRRPGAPRWRGLAWRQYRLERKMFWHNPSAAFFNFLLPLLFLGFFGAILSGNRDALDPILAAIRALVDQLSEHHEDRKVPESTLSLVLAALGDSLLGAPIAQALGLPREASRDIAADSLRAHLAEMHRGP